MHSTDFPRADRRPDDDGGLLAEEAGREEALLAQLPTEPADGDLSCCECATLIAAAGRFPHTPPPPLPFMLLCAP